MAKTTFRQVEKTIYCSGPDMKGNGSKETSSCPYLETMHTVAARFKCSRCLSGIVPQKITEPLKVETSTQSTPEPEKISVTPKVSAEEAVPTVRRKRRKA